MRRLTVPGTGITLTAAVLVLAGCTSAPAPGPTASPTSAPTATTSVTPAPTPSSTPRALLPGESCDPADGSPDCTDATADSEFRYLEGYADCVASFTTDERYGLCTDLDGDGYAGYPDSG